MKTTEGTEHTPPQTIFCMDYSELKVSGKGSCRKGSVSPVFCCFFFFFYKSKAQISTHRGASWVRKSRAPVIVGGQLASWWICTTSLLEKPTAFLNFLPAVFLQYRTPGSSVSLGWLLFSIKYFESNKTNRFQIKAVAFSPSQSAFLSIHFTIPIHRF